MDGRVRAGLNSMLKEFKEIKSTRKELREFGFVVGGIIITIACFGLFKDREWGMPVAGMGGALFIFALAAPGLLLPFQKLWMMLAVVLGAVMSRVVLSILFYLILSPLAVIYRLTGKKFLEVGFRENVDSYWIKRDPKIQSSGDREKQY